jgi:hypothetical protein
LLPPKGRNGMKYPALPNKGFNPMLLNSSPINIPARSNSGRPLPRPFNESLAKKLMILEASFSEITFTLLCPKINTGIKDSKTRIKRMLLLMTEMFAKLIAGLSDGFMVM